MRLGVERCKALLTDTLTIESNGGLLVRAGDRRRTPGGVFFFLVRERCSKGEQYWIFANETYGQAQPTQKQARPDTRTHGPLALTLALWKGLRPMPVTATLKLVLRDLPETREKDGMVYMALANEPRGLPKGITLDSGPLYLTSPVKPWRTACMRAEQIRATGMPALLIVEAHVSTREGALLGVVKGVQVVEGKAPAQAQTTTPAT
jgi:hypothetical protein